MSAIHPGTRGLRWFTVVAPAGQPGAWSRSATSPRPKALEDQIDAMSKSNGRHDKTSMRASPVRSQEWPVMFDVSMGGRVSTQRRRVCAPHSVRSAARHGPSCRSPRRGRRRPASVTISLGSVTGGPRPSDGYRPPTASVATFARHLDTVRCFCDRPERHPVASAIKCIPHPIERPPCRYPVPD